MSLSWAKIVFFYLLIAEFNTDLANASRFPYFRNAKTRWNSKYFSNFTIQIQNNSLYASIDALKTFYKGFKTHVEVQIRLADSKSYQTLFTYNLDICNIVISYKNTIFKKFFRSLLKAGNLMQNCPISSGHYYLEGWKLQPDLIPAYLYAGHYRLKSCTFYGKYKSKDEDFLADIDIDIDLLDHV